jgi:DNA invertase Pin-like site-specific DNA recombinase
MEKSPQTIAYLRVSTTDQDLQNKFDILQLANERNLGKVVWVEEQVSGRVSWKRRKIAQILAGLQSGDNLIVSELSRLGRSMLECMEILSIAAQKQVNIYAVKGNWQLDQSIQSKISQRTKEALMARKQAGMKLGRPRGPGKSKLDTYRLEIEALLANGSTQKFIANRYHTTEANLSRWLARHGLRPQRT